MTIMEVILLMMTIVLIFFIDIDEIDDVQHHLYNIDMTLSYI